MSGDINAIVRATEIGKFDPTRPMLATKGYDEDLAAHGPKAAGRNVLGRS